MTALLDHVAPGQPHTAAHNLERDEINRLSRYTPKLIVPSHEYYGGPDEVNFDGTGIDNYQTALENAFEHAAEVNGRLVIDQAYGAVAKIKQYGGHGIEQLALPRHPASPVTEIAPGIHALDPAFWYQHGDGADGSGSMNDNPGPIHGLHIDGRDLVTHADGLFVSDSAQATIHDLSLTGFTDIGANFGRSQNLNIWNIQVEGPGRGVYFRPLVAGQQGPGHIIFYGGHIHDCYLPIHVEAHDAAVAGPIGFAHDIVFCETIVETGRIVGRAVRCAAVIECGIVSFDNVNFTFGAQVGGGTGNDVEEDCLILVDNTEYTGYSTVVNIVGANTTLGGGTNGVTDAIKIRQSGSANVVRVGDFVGFANVDYKVNVDGSNLGYCDPLLSFGNGDRDITPPIDKVRKTNGGTLFNLYKRTWSGFLFELANGINNGEIGNPLTIQRSGESGPRYTMDWNGTEIRRKQEAATAGNPAPVGSIIGQMLRSGDNWGAVGRFGVADGWYRVPSKLIITADQDVDLDWATGSVQYLAFTVNNKTVTDVDILSTLSAGTITQIPIDGQELRIGISVAAGVTGCSIVWTGSNITWDPDLGSIQPITGLTQYVDLTWSFDSQKWIEVSRSHYSVSGSATPTGAAGGVLSGTYPNPGIANDINLPGNPTVPTQAAGSNNTRIANTAYVKGEIDALKGGVGTAYDTLQEIAAQMASDESGVAALTTVVGTKASLTGAETLTNKRITKRVLATASTGTLTIDSDAYDAAKVTALAANMTIAAPTGTPTGMQNLEIRIKDAGTAKTLTWNAIFRVVGVTLPTTTVIGKIMYIGCKWNSDDSKWDVVAVIQEA